jgi:uncharacterized protein (DUF2336 family)
MLRRLFIRGNDDAAGADPLDYKEQRLRVQDSKAKVRKDLARRTETRPEILYFLAEDKDPVVRQAVAGNQAAPLQADVILSEDSDDDVRVSLADKIGLLVPDMPDEEKQKVRELTEQVLESLAQDEFVKVRATLAEHLKHSDQVPHAVIMRLAQDIETIVAAPVLECSPMLSDQDLLEIIRISQAEGAISAVARRERLSESVADSIASSGDRAAVTELLANQSAQIREETLDDIIARAQEVEPWHSPLVERPTLPVNAIRELSRFVAGSLIKKLARRNEVDETMAQELAAVVEQRECEDQSAQDLFQLGHLNDDVVLGAITRKDEEFVLEALALMSGITRKKVQHMMQLRNPKLVTSLAWKAGLGMRTAMDLQKHTARITPPEILNARFGTEYPLTVKEMTDTLALL